MEFDNNQTQTYNIASSNFAFTNEYIYRDATADEEIRKVQDIVNRIC